MLAILFDIVGAFLVAKYLAKLWVQIIVAIVIGAASSILSHMLMYWLFSGTFTPGETILRIIGGMVWHPLITLVALWLFRRSFTKKHRSVANP